jgi:hypothetical protein
MSKGWWKQQIVDEERPRITKGVHEVCRYAPYLLEEEPEM